jgi:hypothetical protein
LRAIDLAIDMLSLFEIADFTISSNFEITLLAFSYAVRISLSRTYSYEIFNLQIDSIIDYAYIANII